MLALTGKGTGNLGGLERGFERAGGTLAPRRIAGTSFLVGRAGPARVAFRRRGEDGVVAIYAASDRDLLSFSTPFARP